MDLLFKILKENDIIITGNGSACVISFQCAIIKKGQRLFSNSGCASMGYGLPASIGACISKNNSQRIICIEGDGSIMMNLQELQTVYYNKLNIKIIMISRYISSYLLRVAVLTRLWLSHGLILTLITRLCISQRL